MDRFALSNENSMKIPRWLHGVIFEKKYRILKHACFWLFLYADELLSLVGLTEPLGTPFWNELVDMAADMFMVYINIYVLLPRLFLKGKALSYLFWTVITILATLLFNYWCWYSGEDSDLFTFVVANSWANAGIVALAVAFKLFEEAYAASQKIQTLREDKLKTELAYLKTQVNPHFLFNTLNNMYVMSKKKQEELPETIMQLSELLRYQLYETEGDTVPLDNEIGYLKNYLKLEKLRRQYLNLKFEIKGDTRGKRIRPLILLPFIENAFKYSNSGTGSDYIHIVLEVVDDQILFSSENNKGSLHIGDVGGIGLANATRRLELAYPEAHTLVVDDNEASFKVDLKMKTV